MDVSVVIVNYNTFDLTCQCLRSVVDKTEGIAYEVILVDNASSEYDPDEFSKLFPWLKLIKSTSNLGFAGGNNLGIQAARGRFILLLNSDVVLINNAIKFCLDHISSDSRIGALSCKLLYSDGKVQPIAGRFPSITREVKELLRLNKGLSQAERAEEYLGTEFDYENDREVDWIWGSFFMFPKSLLQIFPGKLLPSDYFMYMEDVLWCYAIRKAGFQIWYVKKGEAFHIMNGSSVNQHLDAFARYRRTILPNEYQFIKDYRGWFYVKVYYLIKSINFFSLRTTADFRKGLVYFSLFVKGA